MTCNSFRRRTSQCVLMRWFLQPDHAEWSECHKHTYHHHVVLQQSGGLGGLRGGGGGVFREGQNETLLPVNGTIYSLVFAGNIFLWVSC